MPRIPLSMQLYTLRDRVKTDFTAVLRQLAKLGYQGVELAGYGNLRNAQEVRKAVTDNGLQISGSHVGIEALESGLGKILDEQQILGNHHVICPWMPDTRRRSADDWKRVADSLTRIGQEVAARGMQFAYHNHAFEFEMFGDRSGFDILWDNSDASVVKSELDVYWISHAGHDPAQYIHKLGSRTILLHLKDMAPGAEKKFAPVGTGLLDFKSIDAAGQKFGVKWNIVEQDNCYDQDPMDVARIAIENLRQLGVA